MSTRGRVGQVVSGTDGSDYKDRQVLAARYEAMAQYRERLPLLFTALPIVYAAACVVAAIMHHSPSLQALTRSFLPPFPIHMTLLIVSAALSINSVRLQSNPPFLLLSALSTAFMIYLTILYGWQVVVPRAAASAGKHGVTWCGLTALLHATGAAMQCIALFSGYMINMLRQSGNKRK